MSNNPLKFIDPSGHCGVLPGGNIYGCSSTDTTLIKMKVNYANNAGNEYFQGFIRDTAAQFRTDNPDYTITSDDNLEDLYYSFEDVYNMWLAGDNQAYLLSNATTQQQMEHRLKTNIVRQEIAEGFPTVKAGMLVGFSAARGNLLDASLGFADVWNKGSYNSPDESLKDHYKRHGKEVGAQDADQYLRKAKGFSENLRGATVSNVEGAVPGVKRYKKLGKYIDLAPDGSIISFGSSKRK
ncbi:hypothetical protein ACFQ2I_07060 [Paenibacillus chungangensis]|uniref:Uncharacterized protein n=1 Tax=Paenibacillus chungangensis TaxID=696535 RepID=A0ABW3HNT7_9BACL